MGVGRLLESNTLIRPWGCQIFARPEWGNIGEEASFWEFEITLVTQQEICGKC